MPLFWISLATLCGILLAPALSISTLGWSLLTIVALILLAPPVYRWLTLRITSRFTQLTDSLKLSSPAVYPLMVLCLSLGAIATRSRDPASTHPLSLITMIRALRPSSMLLLRHRLMCVIATSTFELTSNNFTPSMIPNSPLWMASYWPGYPPMLPIPMVIASACKGILKPLQKMKTSHIVITLPTRESTAIWHIHLATCFKRGKETLFILRYILSGSGQSTWFTPTTRTQKHRSWPGFYLEYNPAFLWMYRKPFDSPAPAILL